MLQFFRFNRDMVSGLELPLLSGSDAIKFFLKRTVYLFLFIYATLFLAVATPFVKTPSVPIYFIGSLATTIYLARFINHIIKFIKYRGGSIQVTGTGVTVKGKGLSLTIPADDITYFELNVVGNLLIREKQNVTSFPVTIMKEEDREKLLGQMQDMAPKRTRLYRKLWEFVDAITVALVLAVHIIQFVVQAYYIPSGSMEDTLQIHDRLFVEKITYGPTIPKMMFMDKPIHLSCLGIRDIHRGDIVIFTPPHDEEKDYIKRCVAVAGDKLEIKNGAVYVNGKKQDEPYVKGITIDEGRSRVQGIVPKGHIVVFGDNRENSLDSRIFGYLEISRITGRAFILYWATEDIKNFNFSRFGLIR